MEILWDGLANGEERAPAKGFYINSTEYRCKAMVAAISLRWYLVNFSASIYESSQRFVTYRKTSRNHHVHVANGAEDLQGAAPA